MRYGMIVLTVVIAASAPTAWTATKPLDELPSDVATWSEMTLEVPATMADVNQTEGPISAITWGPAKGTALMIRSVTAETWRLIKPEREKTPGVRRNDPLGPVLRYEF